MRATRVGFTTVAFLVFLLVPNRVVRAEEEAAPKPMTAEQAADAVLEAIRANDSEAVKAFAEAHAPDPWLVAHELWNPENGEGLGAAAVLKKAQAYVRDHLDHPKWKHPYYWVAWVLWGLPE